MLSHTGGWGNLGLDNISPDMQNLGIDLSQVAESSVHDERN